jgi:hypothetical protein
MTGINRKITLDNKHISKHLPDTASMKKLLKIEGMAHVFNDEETIYRVAETIIKYGEFTGVIRGHERYGLYFSTAIGYRISLDGSHIPLHYGEIKITGDKYHVIPRTKPSQ